MRFSIIIPLVFLFLVPPGSCYFSKFLSRLQKTWMRSWERMRNQNLRPRLIKELLLTGNPTFVTVSECVELGPGTNSYASPAELYIG